jgi:hypothetical protein
MTLFETKMDLFEFTAGNRAVVFSDYTTSPMDPAPVPVGYPPFPAPPSPPLPPSPPVPERFAVAPAILFRNKAMEILTRLRAHPETPAVIRKMFLARELFPPKLNVNKFVVGAVAEEYFTRHIAACGFACENIAASANVVDICVDRAYEYSIKSCAAVGRDVILENYRGQKKEIPEFSPTFLIALDKEVGATILYLDHHCITNTPYEKERYRHSDSNLTLRGSFIRHIAKTLPDEYKVVLPKMEFGSTPEVNIASILCDYIDGKS